MWEKSAECLARACLGLRGLACGVRVVCVWCACGLRVSCVTMRLRMRVQ